MSAWSPSNEQRRKEAFWRTKPKDPTQAFKKSGTPYHARRSITPTGGRILMPDDFMPIGEHTGKHLRAVPHAYLLWVNAQPWSQHWPHWQPVADYISRFLLDASDSDQGEGAERSETDDRREPAGQRSTSVAKSLPEVLFYVDRLRQWPTQIRCFKAGSSHLHCLPGNEDKLHAFAVGALHLSRDYYQPGKLPHYDLTVGKHAQSLSHRTVQLIPDPQLIDHKAQWLQFFQTLTVTRPARISPKLLATFPWKLRRLIKQP